MAKKSDQDPERLAQVQQSDLAESRVNEEFVDWLKKWGNSILLAVLLVALAGVAWNWWQRKIDSAQDTAWTNLNLAQLPASLEEVAADSKGIGSVSTLALISAGDQYLFSVQTGTPIGGAVDETDGAAPGLDEATRADYLKRADSMYAQALASIGDYQKDFPKKILACSALFGQAAVAESQGDIEAARAALDKVIATANPEYPDLAAQASTRIETLTPLATAIVLPDDADLPKPPEPEPVPNPLDLLRGNTTAPATDTTEGSDEATSEAETLIIEGADTTSEPAADPAPAEPAADPAPAEPAADPAPAEPAADP
ncbi:MAG: hypothetical protein MK082_03855, partial [Phycisphaerales bacterium]|nr:hypothetical protein [Phycisphaerales bacterium]